MLAKPRFIMLFCPWIPEQGRNTSCLYIIIFYCIILGCCLHATMTSFGDQEMLLAISLHSMVANLVNCH